MFDLDIAWTFYRRLYERLRKLRGLDDMYGKVQDRVTLTGRYDATREAIDTEQRRKMLSIAAAILAGTIIGLNVLNVSHAIHTSFRIPWILVIVCSILAVALAVWVGHYGRWRRSFRKFLKR